MIGISTNISYYVSRALNANYFYSPSMLADHVRDRYDIQ